MNDGQKNALDFLLFSYFSFSLEDLKYKDADSIANLIIKRAYRDASSHVLSVQAVKQEDGLPFTTPEGLKESASHMISACLNCLQQAESDDKTYITWHRNLCSSLDSIYKKARCTWGESNGKPLKFSYGIAQKWVNMTMKYMTITADLCALCDEKNSDFVQKFGDMIARFRNDFHAPVDRYIIDAAGREFSDIVLPTEKESLQNYKFPSDYVESWSRWNPKMYEQFSGALKSELDKEGKSPLDWEGPAWIEQAKGNKGK